MFRCHHRVSPLLPVVIMLLALAFLFRHSQASLWMLVGGNLLVSAVPVLCYLIQPWWVEHVHGHLWECERLTQRWHEVCKRVGVAQCPIYVQIGRNRYSSSIVGVTVGRCYIIVPDMVLDRDLI